MCIFREKAIDNDSQCRFRGTLDSYQKHIATYGKLTTSSFFHTAAILLFSLCQLLTLVSLALFLDKFSTVPLPFWPSIPLPGRDGRLFRVDFGFAWGRTPEIDAPGIFVPNAVYLALGEGRWRQVGVPVEHQSVGGNGMGMGGW